MHKHRRSPLFFIIFCISSAIIAFGIFYYLKTISNAQTIDQLHFREIDRIGRGFQQSIDRLENISKFLQKAAFKQGQAVSTYVSDNNKQGLTDSLPDDLNKSQPENTNDSLAQVMQDEARQAPYLRHVEITDEKSLKPNYTRFSVEGSDFYLSLPNHILPPLNKTNTRLISYFIVTEQGEVFLQQDFKKSPSGIKIDNLLSDILVSSLTSLDSENSQQAEKDAPTPPKHYTSSRLISESSIVEREMAGVRYRIYISPQQFNVKFNQSDHEDLRDVSISDKKQRLFIIGFAPQSDIQLAKLYLSPSIVTIAIAALLILLGASSLLKVRFVSHNYAFTQLDVKRVFMGIVMMGSVISILCFDYLIYSRINTLIQLEASSLHTQLKKQFHSELEDIRRNVMQIDLFSAMEEAKKEHVINTELQTKCVLSPEQIGRLSNIAPHVESMFLADKTGRIEGCYWNWKSEDVSADISSREYFKAAKRCASQPDPDAPCRKELILQRLANLRNGLFQTQIAVATNDDTYPVQSASVVLDVFTYSILPRNFAFAVFENATGKVLYHTNENLSLMDNFYAATNNDNRVLKAVEYGNASATSQPFRGEYYGDLHYITVGRLHDHHDWSLAVLYKKQDMQLLNLIVVITSLLTTGLFYLTIFLLLRLTRRFIPWYALVRSTRRHGTFYLYLTTYTILLMSICLYISLQTLTLFHSLAMWLLSVLCLTYVAVIRTNRAYHFAPWLIGAAVFVGVITLASIPSLALGEEIIMGTVIIAMTTFAMTYLSDVRYIESSNKDTTALNKPKLESVENTKQCLFISYMLAFTALVCIPPSVSFTYHAADHVINKVELMESKDLVDKLEKKINKREHYFALFNIQNKANRAFSNLFFCLPTSTEHGDVERLWQIKYSELSAFCASSETSHSKHIDILTDRLQKATPKHSSQTSFSLMASLLKSSGSSAELIATLNSIHSHTNGASVISLAVQDRIYHAIQHNLFVLMAFALIVGVLGWYVISHIVLNRIIGSHIIEQHRNEDKRSEIESDLTNLFDGSEQHQRVMILRPRRSTIERILSQHKTRLLFSGCLDIQAELRQKQMRTETQEKSVFAKLVPPLSGEAKVSVSESPEQHMETEEDVILRLKDTVRHCHHDSPLLVIKNLSAIALDKTYRHKALEFIEFAMHFPHLQIIIISDVSPLYRLTKQQYYPNADCTQMACATEIMRWASLFTQFSKYYDWFPCHGRIREFPEHPYEILRRECTSWPELERVEQVFVRYHLSIKMNDKKTRSKISFLYDFLNQSERSLFEWLELKVKKAEQNIFKETILQHWTNSEITAFFVEKAGATYRYRWELCTKEERLLLYQLATDHFANPLNKDALEHLIRRGYVVNRGNWELASASFGSFILHAEKHSEMRDWIEDSKESPWRYIRIPLFILVFSLLAIVMYAATEAYETILGLLTATLTLVPVLLRNITLFKGTSTLE
ncbi:hypothetical protein OE749_09610 [Aestuariibacter sp. AA17]|uniref:Uncharacterized protein n=2 Tax=Fluctibacter corallii TaxID=2984329 RepID=A0ABT3A8F0_9ALTE|nr:hypothetical protein [Aestuariibacter sp. AA17]